MFAQAWNRVANGRHASLNSRKLVQNDKQLTKNMFYKFIWCISNFTIMIWNDVFITLFKLSSKHTSLQGLKIMFKKKLSIIEEILNLSECILNR